MLKGKRPAANAKCCVLFVFLLTVLTPVLCYGEAAILKLNYRNASEVLPLVENLLSREGRAAVDTQANSLVIVDTPESIRRVEAFLANLDQPLKQTRIRVKFVEAESQQGGSFSVEGSISGQNWRASKGRPRDGVDIRARTKTSEHREKSEFYIQVASGNWAYMAIGKEIPFSRRWVDLSRRHGRALEIPSIRRIETGLDVKPVLMGDQADVEIVPRISHQTDGLRQEVIRFADASTRVTVPLGVWLEIGGADTQGNEVMSAILETGSSESRSSLSILLMVEAVQ